MRTRLLDMGEVSNIRSQSIHRAIGSLLGPESDPAIVLVRPASPIVSVSAATIATSEIDLDVCRKEHIPVVRRSGDGSAWIVDTNHLLLQFEIPLACAAEAGLRLELERWPPALAQPLIDLCRSLGIVAELGEQGLVEVNGRRIGRFEATKSAAALSVVWEVALDITPELEARLLMRPSGITVEEFATSLAAASTGFARELGATVAPEEIAEALVASVETSFGLELMPSMPTPDEMATLYEWDDRLPIAELFDEAAPSAASPVSYSI